MSVLAETSIKSDRCKLIPLLFICSIIAISLRLITLYFEPVVSRDGIAYIESAEVIQNHTEYAPEFLELHRPSLFTAVISSNITGRSPHFNALLFNITLGSLLPIVVWAAFRELTDSCRIALAGALFAAIHPTLIGYSIEIQRETPYLFFTACFFYFLLRTLNSGKWFYSAGAAASAVIAFFFRYEGTELFFFAGIAYIFMFFKNYKKLQIFYSTAAFIFSALIFLFLVLLFINNSPVQWCSDVINKFSGYLPIG